ncbi:ABC transporter ATP-binding protein [Acrocarpospora pleiomorpha]|uniref:ABC transporter ATP-binding protein n=1 Tax=Acrocarpospora pleiomorpha TaxID=90975 RepID=A0A5M3XMK4_9ACTN|nr:ABC transporter ATP-binding protein [Acrocarpospora pleiomorpha]GES19408.1 ABC transporter ATP-binding protein [Acrocarpospora pleiomorpha]
MLHIDGLTVRQPATGRTLVSGVSFEAGPGESVAIVGESGSGKSLTVRAVLGLLPSGLVAEGEVRIAGQRVNGDPRALRRLRGGTVSLLMQDPFTLLNPLRKVGRQIADGLPRGAGRTTEVPRLLTEVGLGADVAGRYPFQLSGGQRQRVGLAAALAAAPRVLLADEPTTALDATTQREVLALIRRIQRERDMTFLLITHDLRVAFSMCERVVVMYAGRVVEVGRAADLRAEQRHPYTRALLSAEPPADRRLAAIPSVRAAAEPVLDMRDLRKTYPRGSRPALAGVGLTVAPGEIVAVVGESGSGKTTLARCVTGLERPDAGTILLAGQDCSDYTRMPRHQVRWARRTAQMIFQDPYSTLNPARTVGATLKEALAADGRPADVAGLLELVGLDPALARLRPAHLSGGERQRVAIARAVAGEPRLLICDEPVSALDVSVQAQILTLLAGLRERLSMGMLFITHDLAVVRQLADRLYVLRAGECVETGPVDRVLDAPAHPYTRELLASVPDGSARWPG